MKFKHIKLILAAALAVISTGLLSVSAADFKHTGYVYWVCDESGHGHDVSCSCGGIAKEPHNSDVTLTVHYNNATCIEMGYDSATQCSVCGYITSYHYTTPALGHDWNNGEITVQPTTTSDGVKTIICSRCYKTKTEVIPKLANSSIEPPASAYPTTPTEPIPPAAPTYDKGDVNKDGRVNAADATLVLKHAVGLITLSGDDFDRADINGDGKVNAKDATKILRIAVAFE